MPTLGEIRSQLVKTGIATIVLAPVGYFLKQMFASWGALDPYAKAAGEYLKIHVTAEQFGWTLAGIVSLLAYIIVLLRIWRRAPAEPSPWTHLSSAAKAAAIDRQNLDAARAQIIRVNAADQ